jgi:hypothetical protein
MDDFGQQNMHISRYHSIIPKHDYSISCAIQLIHMTKLSVLQTKYIVSLTRKKYPLYRKPASKGVNQFYSLLAKLLYISPHSAMTQANFGRLLGPVATFSIFLTTKRPSPSTLCIKESHVNTQHINSLGEERC